MKFINENDFKMVRQKDDKGIYMWKSVNKDEEIELPKEIGELYGFTEVKSVSAKSGTTFIETKRVERPEKKKPIKKKTE